MPRMHGHINNTCNNVGLYMVNSSCTKLRFTTKNINNWFLLMACSMYGGRTSALKVYKCMDFNDKGYTCGGVPATRLRAAKFLETQPIKRM